MSCARQERIALNLAVIAEAEYLNRLEVIVPLIEYAYPVFDFLDFDPSVMQMIRVGIQ